MNNAIGAATLGSFNHLPFGAVGEWVYRTVGGINPDDSNPGFKSAIIKPELGGGITNAFASFNSIHGPVVCSWTNDAGGSMYLLNLKVPANATATIFMPTTNIPSGFTEDALGTIHSAATTLGILTNYSASIPGWTNGATVFKVGSGTYRFAITNVVLQ